MSNPINYRFSPSTLDKFTKLLGAQAEFESDFNYTEEGGYKNTLEEIVAARTLELLDAVNKVEHEPVLAASRGTAFNEAVDYFIEAAHVGHVGTSLQREKSKITAITDSYVQVACEGFGFLFDRSLVEGVAQLMADGTAQLHVEATIETEQGTVLLHGYPDYILPTQVTDLKTTESYTWGKYEHYWQRYAYPYVLLASGMMERVDCFEFLVVEMKTDRKTGLITGTVYKEVYTDTTLEKCRQELEWICDGLAMWCNENRDKITNPKIFGL